MNNSDIKHENCILQTTSKAAFMLSKLTKIIKNNLT